MNTKHLFLSIVSLITMTAAAEKVEVDGVYYNIGNGKAEVTFRGDDEDGWMYYNYDELYTGDVVIPESITYNNATYAVTSIGNDAFAGSKIMTGLSLPASITKIGTGIFSLCNNLDQIVVDGDNPEFLSYEGVLYTKKDMELYFVPKGIWGEVTLLDGITTIPLSAFQNCTGITTVSLPSTVKEINDGAFYGCTALEEIFLNDGLTSIGEYAFSKCTSLQIISLPESVRTIKDCAFADCTNLYYALLHEGITSIGKMAFFSCENLIGIELPSTLTVIAEKAFLGCVNLTTVKNDSKLNVVLGSESNGYVAYYASEILEETASTTLLKGNTTVINQTPDGVTISNAAGAHYSIFDYNGRVLKKGVCLSDYEVVATNGKRVVVSVR